MSEPFIGEIRMASFGFAARGWALCNGQILPINQNQALFSLLGTTYGGNGQTNFALPDLRGRVPFHFGAGHSLGERAGEQRPHTHHRGTSGAHASGDRQRQRRLAGQPFSFLLGDDQCRRLRNNSPGCSWQFERHSYRRRWSPREHVAVPHDHLHDRPPGHFSRPQAD